ncbi:MAG: AAA family ATPase [Clostridia bacterium]|nr:AAA family ATPase [Clostridia bacterium]
MFIVVSGISGSGKNTVINRLLSERANLRCLEYSSATTRPPRESDSDNKTYVYMSVQEFEKGISEGRFFEYENVHGNYYGTLLERLQFVVDNQNLDFMRDIDVKGNRNLKKFFAGKCPMVSIFLDAPDEVIRARLTNRGDAPADIEKRISRGELERSYKCDYDLVIENIDLEKTISSINKFLDNVKK